MSELKLRFKFQCELSEPMSEKNREQFMEWAQSLFDRRAARDFDGTVIIDETDFLCEVRV